jgi:hypothetical protein
MENTISIESKVRHLEKTYYKKQVKAFAEAIKTDGFISSDKWKELTGKEVRWSPSLHAIKKAARHYHIAASMLRGKKYEQIESPRQNNFPDKNYILKLVEEAQFAILEESEKMKTEEVVS